MGDHADLERVLADALSSTDPAERLEAAAADPALSAAVRSALAGADPDGVRITALIVARLRFERLIQGSRVAREWFERDPRTFTAAFKRYHASVPTDASMPGWEAQSFDAWAAERHPDAPSG